MPTTDTIPVKRFYKIISIMSLSLIILGIGFSMLAYHFGKAEGITDSKLENSLSIISEQATDNEIISEEYNKFISLNDREYLLDD